VIAPDRASPAGRGGGLTGAPSQQGKLTGARHDLPRGEEFPRSRQEVSSQGKYPLSFEGVRTRGVFLHRNICRRQSKTEIVGGYMRRTDEGL